MKKCSFYEESKNDFVNCTACRHYCTIPKGGYGICGARKNVGGSLMLLTYAKPASVSIDPIEKKPLFHYLPGSQTFSVGFYGCNFRCAFCQNFDLSTTKGSNLEQSVASLKELTPAQLIESAKKTEAKSIAFTYNEPAVSAEYNIEAIKLTKKVKLAEKSNSEKSKSEKLGTVYVSNGYASKEQIKVLKKSDSKLDAINIDLKSFSEDFYRKLCGAQLENVLNCIKEFQKAGTWVELTTLLIPGRNNSPDELAQMASWIRDLDKNIPWHVTAFFPTHELRNVPPTTREEIATALEIGKEAGLRHVYGGNLHDSTLQTTWCSKCGAELITRTQQAGVEQKGLSKSKCVGCGEKVAGVFK